MKIHQYIGIVVAKKRFPWLTRKPSLRHAARAWLLLSGPGAEMYFKTLVISSEINCLLYKRGEIELA